MLSRTVATLLLGLVVGRVALSSEPARASERSDSAHQGIPPSPGHVELSWYYFAPPKPARLPLAITSELALWAGLSLIPWAVSHNAEAPSSKFTNPAAPDSGTHPYRAWADTVSDYSGSYAGSALAIAAVTYPFEALRLSNGAAPWSHAVVSATVAAEAALLASTSTYWLKRVAWRCRPNAYVETTDTEPARCDADNEQFSGDTATRAFPSGHTAPIAAIAGANFALALRNTGSAWYRWLPVAISESMTLATSYLRVESGAHSPTDVLAAWGIGHLIGVAVVFAHPMGRSSERTSATWRFGVTPTGAALGGQF